MNHAPRTRILVSCTLLVIALGASAAACGSDGNPLAATPYDAADRITFNAPTGDGKKADPDKPLEVTAEDDDDRITDVTATDATGRYVAGGTAPPRRPPRSTPPPAPQPPSTGPGGA